MVGADRARLLLALHRAAVSRVEDTDKILRNVAAEVFRNRHKPGPQDALALIDSIKNSIARRDGSLGSRRPWDANRSSDNSIRLYAGPIRQLVRMLECHPEIA